MSESNDPGASYADYPSSRRAPKRRPAKPIPTDRMKWEVQLKVLRTVGELGRRVMDAEMTSSAMDGEVSRYTVALSHAFFVECGWLDRVGRGEWRPTDALLGFSRQAQYDLAAATAYLREPARGSWAWQIIEPTLEGGPVKVNAVLALLAHGAEADDHHTQLMMTLQWFEFVRLIDVNDNMVRLSAAADFEPVDEDEPSMVKPDTTPAPEAVPPVQESTTAAPERSGALLNFDFSLSLTVDDLAKLTPEQIAAVFEAVGKVAAIQRG